MDKIKVLFFAANPTGTFPLKLDEEVRAITQKIRASQYRDVLKLESFWAVRPDDLLQSLNEHKPQIVHFSGHGSRAGELMLVDNSGSPKAVSREALKSLFTTLKDNIQMVILNACYSQVQAEAITAVIGCVIGMNDAIGDQAAIIFAASFYRAIGFGCSVQDAFDQGKIALLLEGIPEATTPELLMKEGVDPSQLFLVEQQIKREREGTHKTIKGSTANSLSNQPPTSVRVPRPANFASTDNVKKPILTSISLGTLLCTYQNHTTYVNAVAWSPDGTRIASASSDHTVQVWDASNGQKVFSYRGHLEVYALVWSPHGTRVWSGGREGEIQEWDIPGKYKVFTYQGHTDAIFALTFSPDGTRIASASWDKTVRIWDVATRQIILTYRSHSDWVKALSWSPDSSCVASGGSDKTVQIWNAATGRNIFTYHSHNNCIEGVAWSPDGTRIASGGLDKTIQVWDATTGNLFSTYRGHTHFVQALAWSPDGTRIASASWDKTVQIWDATTAHCIFSYQGHSSFVKAVAWSPDGTRIASASEDGTVHIWQSVTLFRFTETLSELTERVAPSFGKETVMSKIEDTSTISADMKTDVVIITALQKECEAVLRHLGSYQEVRTKGRTFYKASIQSQKSNHSYQVVVLSLTAMGNYHAALATQQAISVWNPSYIILAGIAGGVQKGNSRYLGDLLVGEQIVSYEPGKQTESGIQRRYEVYRPAKILLEAAKNLPLQEWALATIVPRPDGTTKRIIPQVHFGVVASGEKVVADTALTNELQSDWSQLVGIEMEGVGIATAAYYADYLPGILLVKGMCDWADSSKNDGWQEYAADAAASFVIGLLKSEPFESKVKSQPIRKDEKTSSFSGKVKISICTKLIQDWEDLADFFDIPDHHRARFVKGREPQSIWEWLSLRGKLSELESGLEFIGRDDLVDILKQHQNG